MCRLKKQYKMKSGGKKGKKRQHEIDVVSEIREEVITSLAAEDSIRETFEKMNSTKLTPDTLRNLPPKMTATYLFANYEARVISYVTSFLPELRVLPVSVRLETICSVIGCSPDDASFIFDACLISHDVLLKVDHGDLCSCGYPILLTPPTKTCLLCNCLLSQHNKPCDVTIHSVRGKTAGLKFSLRCTQCDVNYNYDQYGNTTKGWSLYEERRPLVEASDICFIDRKLLSFQCALA